MQIVASLLAVPLGLASGYSIYRANFSPETTCQGLRGNIIGMLDKNVDAATRRMLVRRDVAAFEQNCGGVDPDAHAAFKALLAAGKPAADKVTPKIAPVPKVNLAAAPAELARPQASKPGLKPAQKPAPKTENKLESEIQSKPESKPESKAQPDPVEREAGISDARWLAEVRQALVTHGPERVLGAGPAQLAPVATMRPAATQIGKSPSADLQPSWNVTAPAVAQPAVPTVPSPQMSLNGADHPVPPASIPVTAPREGEVNPVNGEPQGRSTLGAWIAQIPILGPATEPLRN